MASSVQQTGNHFHSAITVANAFVQQYYLAMVGSPELVHRFYHDSSQLGRAGEDGVMSITTTMQAINEKIISLDLKEGSRAEISTVDGQESLDGGILVSVTGYLTGKDSLKREFSQTFFLAPQETGGYFILNDVLRYIGGDKLSNETKSPANNVVPPQDLPLQKDLVQEKVEVSEKGDTQSENVQVSILTRAWKLWTKLSISCLLCAD